MLDEREEITKVAETEVISVHGRMLCMVRCAALRVDTMDVDMISTGFDGACKRNLKSKGCGRK